MYLENNRSLLRPLVSRYIFRLATDVASHVGSRIVNRLKHHLIGSCHDWSDLSSSIRSPDCASVPQRFFTYDIDGLCETGDLDILVFPYEYTQPRAESQHIRVIVSLLQVGRTWGLGFIPYVPLMFVSASEEIQVMAPDSSLTSSKQILTSRTGMC